MTFEEWKKTDEWTVLIWTGVNGASGEEFARAAWNAALRSRVDLSDIKVVSRGAFVSLEPEAKDLVNGIVGCWHVRNGAKHPDGSRGDIRMSPDELRDLVAYLLQRGAGIVEDPKTL